MSRKIRDTAAALLFLAILLAGMCYLARNGYQETFVVSCEGILPTAKTLSPRRSAAKPLSHVLSKSASSQQLERFYGLDDTVEQALTDTLDHDRLFIEGYGLTQRLLGRRVMEDVDPQHTVVRLGDGSLIFADPDGLYQKPAWQAQALIDFRDKLAETQGIPLLYVQAPQKYFAQAGASLPDGLADQLNPQADSLLQMLEADNVDTLDLRLALAGTGRYSSLFFSTDHHWTAEGAFIGWQSLAKKLEADYSFSIPFTATNPYYWTQTTLEDHFLGSQGKRVGSLYAGVDDFEVWSPKFDTALSYQIPIQGYEEEGTFEEVLLFPDHLEKGSLYETNPYLFYSGGDFPFARMKNLNHPNGPTVVLLRDSFACPFAPFMALGCGELVTMDLRYFNDDLMEYISWVNADLVVVLYSPGAFGTEAFFAFEEVVS